MQGVNMLAAAVSPGGGGGASAQAVHHHQGPCSGHHHLQVGDLRTDSTRRASAAVQELEERWKGHPLFVWRHKHRRLPCDHQDKGPGTVLINALSGPDWTGPDERE